MAAVLCQIKLGYYIWLVLQINFSRGGVKKRLKNREHAVCCPPFSRLFIIIEGDGRFVACECMVWTGLMTQGPGSSRDCWLREGRKTRWLHNSLTQTISLTLNTAKSCLKLA